MSLSKKLFLLLSVPLIVAVAFAISFFLEQREDYLSASAMQKNISLLLHSDACIDFLQQERGLSMIFMGGGISSSEIEGQRKKSDEAVALFLTALKRAEISAEAKGQIKTLERLSAVRQLTGTPTSTGEVFSIYTQMISNLMKVNNAVASAKTAKGIGKMLVNIIILADAQEGLAQFRGFVSGLLTKNAPIDNEKRDLAWARLGRFGANARSQALFLSPGNMLMLSKIFESPEWKVVNGAMGLLAEKSHEGNYGVDGNRFFADCTKMITVLLEVKKSETQELSQKVSRIMHESEKRMVWIAVILVVLIAGLLISGFLFSRHLVASLRETSKTLSESVSETSQAAESIADASEFLAAGVNKQSSSIGGSRAAVEQIVSMIQNASEYAQRATVVANGNQEGTVVCRDALKSLRNAVESAKARSQEQKNEMGVMRESSRAISQVIKTIDEIAFQTNILALNAAVEAARAGDAGVGFAVVADEVRNLAHRSASAAKETAELIENSISRSERGVTIAMRVDEDLSGVLHQTEQVQGSLQQLAEGVEEIKKSVNAIASAGREQASGVEQIRRFIHQMDESTQENASTSEETASAAEELRNQARMVKADVEMLLHLVTGKE